MAKENLRFYCRGQALVADVHAQERGKRRFVGRRWQEVLPGRWGFCPTEQPEELPYHHDLAKACRDGDLWAADEATAKACGVPFDPDFGGEMAETIKAFKAKAEKAKAEKKDDAKAAPGGGKADV
jgi:hypothetical protein